MHKRKTPDESRPFFPNGLPRRTPLRLAVQADALPLQQESPAKVKSRFVLSDSASAHAAMLNRTQTLQPELAPQSLLQLQRQFGNCYVQRVMAISTQNGRKAAAGLRSKKEVQTKQQAGQMTVRQVHTGLAEASGPAHIKIQREPAPHTPAQVYEQALTRLQRLDRRIHGYISLPSLNGSGPTQIHRVVHGNTTTIFTLQIRITPLASAHAELQRLQVQPPVRSGTSQTRTVAMILSIDPPTGSNAVGNLTESLLHEGLHMLLQMDRFLPTAQQSPHTATYGNFDRIARGHNDFGGLVSGLGGFLQDFFTHQLQQGSTSPLPPPVLRRVSQMSQTAAQSIVTDLIEEKFVENTVATQLARQRQANSILATSHLDSGLSSLGVNPGFIQDPQHPQRRARLRSIIHMMVNILDAIDQSLQPQPVQSPQPAPPPPPAPAPPPSQSGNLPHPSPM